MTLLIVALPFTDLDEQTCILVFWCTSKFAPYLRRTRVRVMVTADK